VLIWSVKLKNLETGPNETHIRYFKSWGYIGSWNFNPAGPVLGNQWMHFYHAAKLGNWRPEASRIWHEERPKFTSPNCPKGGESIFIRPNNIATHGSHHQSFFNTGPTFVGTKLPSSWYVREGITLYERTSHPSNMKTLSI
jgi:hypothetical protein